MIKFQKQIYMGNVVVRFKGGDRDRHMTDLKTEGWQKIDGHIQGLFIDRR